MKNNDGHRLKILADKINGEVKTSVRGNPYLVINTHKCSERIRVMYFTRNRQYSVYLDKGLSLSTKVGRFSTPTEVLDAVKPFTAKQ